MIVVFDTNVLIPLVLDASRSARLFARLVAAGHQVAVSEPILDEVREKMRTKASLRRWLDLLDEEMEDFLTDLPHLCLVVPGEVKVEGIVANDPDDDKVIAAGLESEASYIISEDRHLLALAEWRGIQIMDRRSFEMELDRLGVP